MVSIYIQVKYISIIHITSKSDEEFFKGLDKIIRKYNSERLTITIIHIANNFKLLMDKVKDELYVIISYSNP